MTGIGEGIAAGFMGILMLIILLLLLIGVVCSFIYILHKIPSVPIYIERDTLYFRDAEIIPNDADAIVMIAAITIGLAVLFTLLYLIGFVLIEYGGMTIEISG